MAHRWVIAGLAVLVMFSTGPLFMMVGKDFLPQEDQSEFEITVRTPAGSSLEGTDTLMRRLEDDVKTLPGVRNLLTTVGADLRKQVDRGSIIVELAPPEERQYNQIALMRMARAR